MNQVLSMENVTRIVIGRAKSWRSDSPMFTIEFKWDQSKSRSGESLYTKYIWNTNYRNPKMQNGAAVELDIKDVVSKCNAIGLEYKKAFDKDPGDNELTVWSSKITKEQKEEYIMSNGCGIKVDFKGGKKNRRGNGAINWNDDAVVDTNIVFEAKEETIETIQVKEEVTMNGVDLNKLRQEVEAELRAKLQEEARAKAEAELRKELEEEVRQEVLSEMKEQLEREMMEEIKAKLVSEMKNEIRNEVKDALKKEIKEELSGNKVNNEPSKKVIKIADDIVTAPKQIDYVIDDVEYDEPSFDYEKQEPLVVKENVVVSKKKKSRRDDTPISFDSVDTGLTSNDGFSEGFNWVD